VTALAERSSLPYVVDQPGLYQMSADHYHRDPVPQGSLSSSGARALLPPSCPAKFRHEQLHGRPSKPAFDLGHAAHSLVLEGDSTRVVIVDAEDWKTKSAREQRDAAQAAGLVPLLADDWRVVQEMAAALRAHPIAAALFNPERGQPEQSAFWQDETHGVWRRARFDWLPDLTPSGRLIVGDYKTTVSAEPRALAKSAANFGYHQQAAFYLDAVTALDLADEAAFVFVSQEKTAPYLVTAWELDREALDIGRALNEQALAIYAECMATDVWPNYTDDVALISLPAWATYSFGDLR
jgi:hypothetical protein